MSTSDCGSRCALAENLISTELKVHVVTHLWQINTFEYYENKGFEINTDGFSAETNDEEEWFMKLKPNGETESKDTLSLYLHLSDDSKHKKLFAKCYLRFINEELKKQVAVISDSVMEFNAGGAGWGVKDFFKDHDFRETFLVDGRLKVACEVIFSQESDAIVEYLQCRSTPSHDVTENFGMLLDTNFLSDIVISVNKKKYLAHKAILAARSEVFAAMFKHDTKENQRNRIDIKDMSQGVVGEMLRFIYTGKCEKLDELAEGLLVAADKYDLAGLKVICSVALCKKLTIENAAQNLILADRHNAIELKSRVTKFIIAKSTEVFDTAGWENIRSYPALLEEMLKAAVHR